MTTGTVAAELMHFVEQASAAGRSVTAPRSQERQERIPSAELGRLWASLAAARHPDALGFRLAQQWRPHVLGLNDYLFASSKTLRDAFVTALSYAHVLSDDGAVNQLAVTESECEFTLHYEADAAGCGSSLASEFAIALLLTRARTAFPQLTPTTVRLSSAPPRRTGAYLERLGTADVRFGEASTSMTFAHADLLAEMPEADATLSALLVDVAGRPRSLREDGSRLQRFRRELALSLSAGQIDEAGFARKHALSVRSLQRMLSDLGTSWRAELDAIRASDAERALVNGATRAEVAARLGYSDERALRRALARWHAARQ